MPPPQIRIQDEAHSPLTLFPCLTGLRPGATRKATITETHVSTLTIPSLQNATRDTEVTPAAVVEAAWGELLASFVGAREEVTFLSILPRACGDGCCSRLKRKTICRYRRQAQGQKSITANLLRHGGRLEEELDGSSDLEAPRQVGTILDLEGLYGPNDGESLEVEDNSTQLWTENNIVTIAVRSKDSNTLSFRVNGPISHLNNEAARLLTAQFDHILQKIVSNLKTSVNEIYRHAPIALSSISQQDSKASDPFTSLQSIFEFHASTSPNLAALEFWTSGSASSTSLGPSTVLTFGDLNNRASHLAAHLVSRFSPLTNHIIPICMDRSPELYVTILGILKAGAAWCPIDPSFPPRRRHDLIARTHATAMVVNIDSPMGGIPENVSTVNITELEKTGSTSSPDPLFTSPAINPSDLAYLIWTSGTTGPPKGVPIHHRAASTSMRALQSLIPATTTVKSANPERHFQIRTLQFSAFSFDVFVQDLFYTWNHGGTLIAAPRSVMLSSFTELATKSSATHAHLTPAFGASVFRDSCPTLQVVTMIGERLEQGVADAWSRPGGLYNTYGPAEATVVATVREVRAEDGMQAANVGVPMPDVGGYVIRDGEVVLRGGVGELALSGAQLSKGYWEDEERTAERFVWNRGLGMRLYMTGDVVRQLHDGSFEFIGRVDDLIKIQGIRIELSEIAFALRNCHEEVRRVEVQFLARPDRPSKVIVAFLVVPRLGSSRTAEIDKAGVQVARRALGVARNELPEYMVPKVFLVVDAIPRTASAKIDRAAITKLYADVDLEVWEKELTSAVQDGGVNDDLDPQDFVILASITELTGSVLTAQSQASTLPSIGIDSITATRLATRLLVQGVDVPVADILQCQTLHELLQYPRKARAVPKHDAFDTRKFHQECTECLDADLAERVERVMPTLPLQESLLSETFQQQNSYWNHNLYRLAPDIDLQQLKRAWSEVSGKTDALRTGFCPVAELSRRPPIDATFLQLIYKEAEIDWRIDKLSRTEFNDHVKAQAHRVAERYQTDRSTEPPWAVTIFTGVSPSTMLFSIHHSIRDERSLDFIMADLHDAYTSTDQMQRRQLRDAVSILHNDNEQIRRDSTFWTASLHNFANVEDCTSWPELRLSSQKATEGTLTYEWIAKNSFKTLQARVSKMDGVTLASILRVAWGFMLLEYLEADKLVFGETRSARGQSSTLADVVGPLVRVIPVPIHLDNHSTARQLLHFDAEFHKKSAAHSGVHPRTIRNILGRREGEALYPAIFNFLPEPEGTDVIDNDSLWESMDDMVGLSVEHAIALSVYLPGTDSVEFELTVGKQYMDCAHLEILARQLDSLLDRILDDPDRELSVYSRALPPGLLSIVPAEDIKRHNHAWTENPTQWVDRNALAHPGWPAAEVVDSLEENDLSSRSWTYQQLREAYRSVAALIHEVGYTRKMIAVCLDRRLDVYAVVLAIMYTGNTYLPIAEELPEERKLLLLRDSEAVMFFTTGTLHLDVPQSCQTILVENLDYTSPPDFEVGYQTEPSAGAYLLYTSGSTGTPKGVIISRGNLTTFIAAISQFIHSHVDIAALAGKGKWLGMASYAFDVHLLEMFFPWRHGISTVTAPRTLLLDNLELALRKLHVTHASFVPSLVDNAGLDPANLPDLRYMSVGGEKITRKAIDTWSRSHVVLANAYGPTEMTIGCCFKRVEPDNNVRNVGLPLAYTTAHVLRPGTTEYALRGTAGELCLTGDLVATGYHKQPDAKGFVDDFHGARLYRTGDRVRMMADASLEFLGRDDDQTKIRGQRIELVEVSDTVRIATEKVLSTGNVDVAAMVVQHPSLARPQLVAFIAVRDGGQKMTAAEDSEVITFQQAESAEAIRLYCGRTLPSFMVPELFICLTSLPLASTSCKIDNKRLQALFAEISLADLTSHTKPTSSIPHTMSEIEYTVREVTADVLSMEKAKIDIDTNLFRLGLDSLNVINLTIKLHKVGLESTVSNILKAPTVRQMACLPRKRAQNGTLVPQQPVDLKRRFKDEVRNGIDLSNVAAVRPCLPLQETLVASSLNHEGEALYVNHIMLQLSPVVDRERLMKAWTATAADHEILRTCFHELGKHFVQVVLRESPLICERITIPASSTHLDYLQQREPQIAADLIARIESRPPIKLTYAASGGSGEKGMLMVSIHHALYDGEAFAMILDEVFARYEDITPRKRTPINALLYHIESQSQQNAQHFWKTYLKGYELTLFSLTLKAPDNESASLSMKLATSFKAIEDFAASLNSTPASTVQALFGIILSEIHSTHDIVFGTVLSGRTVPVEDAHTILAPCITTIPQRLTIHPTLSLVQTISRAHKGFVDCIEYQQTALRDIHRWVEAEAPLFDTLFTYTRKRSAAPWEKLWQEVRSSMASEFPLALEIEADQDADRVVARINYTAAFGTESRARSMLERLEELIEALALGDPTDISTNFRSKTAVPSSSTAREQSCSDEEVLMREIIAELVGIPLEEISTDASFFALGLDSIIAIQFAKRLRQHGVHRSSAQVMRYSSIRKLAGRLALEEGSDANGYVEGAQKGSSPAINGDVVRPHKEKDVYTNGHMEHPSKTCLPRQDADSDVVATYPCTPLQSSMLTQTLGSDGSFYVHHHGARLPDHIDTLRIKEAWERLVSYTEILRTSFHFSEDSRSWAGFVHHRSSISWHEHETSSRLEQLMPQIKSRFIFKEASDFATPPWSIDVVGDNFILSLHHSLYDGESLSLMLQDLAALCKGTQISARLPFSKAARAINERAADAEEFWVRKLDGFQGTLRTRSTRPIKEAKASLDLDLAAVLQGCKSLGVTLQSVALLAYGKALAWLSKRQHVVFGHVVRGRTLAELDADEVVGPLFNTVPFWIDLSVMSATNKNAVRTIQAVTGESHAHQHAALSRVQQEWRERNGHPEAELLDALFVFQKKASQSKNEQPLWDPVTVDEDTAPTEYGINLEFEQREAEIGVCVNSTCIDDLDMFLRKFEDILRDILERPDNTTSAGFHELQGANSSVPNGIAMHEMQDDPIGTDENARPQDKNDLNPTDSRLCTLRKVLSQISGLPASNITDDTSIFSLGLDSISAIQIAAIGRKEGLKISVADVLQGRTVRGIRERMGRKETNSLANGHVEPNQAQPALTNAQTPRASMPKIAALAGLRDEEVEAVLPCGAGQQYHVATWLKSGRTLGEITFAYICEKPLDCERLLSAWRSLRERNAIFRTVLVATGSTELVQVLLKPAAVRSNAFQWIDLPDCGPDSVRDVLKEEACRHFDFWSPPAELLAIHTRDVDYMVLRLHHALYDAATISSLTKELNEFYEGRAPPSHLPPTSSLPPFPNLQAAQTYWQESLRNCQKTLLRTQAPAPKSPARSFFFIKSHLPNLHNLETECQQHHTTLPTIILLAFARTLTHHTSIPNPAFGLYQSARFSLPESSNSTLHPQLNVTPMMIQKTTPRDTRSSITAIQNDLAARIPHEQSFLHHILADIGYAHTPLFNTYINILPSTSNPSATSSSPSLFTPYSGADMQSIAPSRRVPGATAVDRLDTSMLAEGNSFLDVQRCGDEDRLVFVGRCDRSVLSEGEAEGFVERVGREVRRCVDELSGRVEGAEAG